MNQGQEKVAHRQQIPSSKTGPFQQPPGKKSQYAAPTVGVSSNSSQKQLSEKAMSANERKAIQHHQMGSGDGMDRPPPPSRRHMNQGFNSSLNWGEFADGGMQRRPQRGQGRPGMMSGDRTQRGPGGDSREPPLRWLGSGSMPMHHRNRSQLDTGAQFGSGSNPNFPREITDRIGRRFGIDSHLRGRLASDFSRLINTHSHLLNNDEAPQLGRFGLFQRLRQRLSPDLSNADQNELKNLIQATLSNVFNNNRIQTFQNRTVVVSHKTNHTEKSQISGPAFQVSPAIPELFGSKMGGDLPVRGSDDWETEPSSSNSEFSPDSDDGRMREWSSKEKWLKEMIAEKQKQLAEANGSPNSSVDMAKWSSGVVRRCFLQFFEQQGHVFVPPASVVPSSSSGLYFTNAGMNQFAKIFSGELSVLPQPRVANYQKCIRIGGKHNDLLDVGYDGHHQTFFEMLGNWSFNNYTPRDACEFSLNFLNDVCNLPIGRLYFTYFNGDKYHGIPPNLETRDVWLSLGVPFERVIPAGYKDNFWAMGETGPCGPCTEIHYDHIGERNAPHLVNSDSSEVTELWNIVFLLYNRSASGDFTKLSKQYIDTGLGLERLVAILQNSKSTYDTDAFTSILRRINELSGVRNYSGIFSTTEDGRVDTAYRVVADHIRMASMCIADGLLPTESDLGHKLRHVIRRAMRRGFYVLKMKPGFFSSLVPPVVDSLGNAYPELAASQDKIIQTLNESEASYAKSATLVNRTIRNFLNNIGDTSILTGNSVGRHTGEMVHQLVSGKFGGGLSVDLLNDIALERGIFIDIEDYQRVQKKNLEKLSPPLINEQSSDRFALAIDSWESGRTPKTDDSLKHVTTELNDAVVVEILAANSLPPLPEISCENDKFSLVGVLLNKTCFYSASGGQISDIGDLIMNGHSYPVVALIKRQDFVVHVIQAESSAVSLGQHVSLRVDQSHRLGCSRGHTATHIIAACLRYFLSSDLVQRGSKISSDRFTFDFSCLAEASADDIRLVEAMANDIVTSDFPVYSATMPLNDALSIPGATFMSHVKYSPVVKMVAIADNMGYCIPSPNGRPVQSLEACGGTHVSTTEQIGPIVVHNLRNISRGTKRLFALTGEPAKQALTKMTEAELKYINLLRDLETTHVHDYNSCGQQIKEIDKMLTARMPIVRKERLTAKLSLLKKRLKLNFSASNADNGNDDNFRKATG